MPYPQLLLYRKIVPLHSRDCKHKMVQKSCYLFKLPTCYFGVVPPGIWAARLQVAELASIANLLASVLGSYDYLCSFYSCTFEPWCASMTYACSMTCRVGVQCRPPAIGCNLLLIVDTEHFFYFTGYPLQSTW